MSTPQNPEQSSEVLLNFRLDPVKFVRGVLGRDTWEMQDTILRELAVPNARVAVKSAHSTGKTQLSADTAIWHTATGGITLTTAPSWTQVESQLWGYMHKTFESKKHLLGGEPLKTEWHLAPTVFARGLSTNEGVRFQGYHCFTANHEILTRRGWLTFTELSLEDEVLSVPVNEDVARWMPVTGIHTYEVDQNINVYRGKSTAFEVTNGHRFPVQTGQNLTWSLQPLDTLSANFRVRRISLWDGDPFAVPEPFAKYGWSPEKFAEFLGFWIGDGGTRPHSTCKWYEVILYQTKQDNGYLQNLLSGMRLGRGNDYVAFSDRECATWLVDNVGRLGQNRRVPKEIMDSIPSVLEAFLNGFWHAEGSFENGVKTQVYNSNRVLMDQIQEICIKLGHPTTIGLNSKRGCKKIANGRTFEAKNDCWTLCWNSTPRNSTIKHKNITTEKYKGTVWCISTPYETFYTRLNGQVFLSGNSSPGQSLLVIIDEAVGVRPDIWEAIEGQRAGGDVRVLALGNPTLASGPFYDAFRNPNSGWVTYTVSALNTPNLRNIAGQTKEQKLATLLDMDPRPGGPLDDNVRPYLTKRRWVYEKYHEWGPDSPLWYSRVLGEFPPQSDDSLISVAWLDSARTRFGATADIDEFHAGIDVAGPGESETVCVVRNGTKILDIQSWTKPDPRPEVTQMLAYWQFRSHNRNSLKINVDSAGNGWYFYLHLKDKGFDVTPINVGSGVAGDPANKEKYVRLKDQLYWQLRELFRDGLVTNLQDDLTAGQLAAIRYFQDSRNRIAIETKEAMAKRGVPSPDRAEALMLAFTEAPAEPTKTFIPVLLQGGIMGGWGDVDVGPFEKKSKRKDHFLVNR